MHRMHRIFSGDGWLVVLDIRIALGKAFEFENRFAEMDESSPCMPVALKSLMVWAACFGTRVLTDLSSTTTFSSTFLDIRKSARASSPESASRAAASRADYPVHPVHRCSIYDPSRWICPVAGKRELPNGCRPAFREVARRIPPPRHREDTPRERGRPARILSLCLALSFPAMRQQATLPAGTPWAQPKQSHGAAAGRPRWRRWARLCQDLCGRDARAPGWASSHDIVTPREHNRRSIRAPLVI